MSSESWDYRMFTSSGRETIKDATQDELKQIWTDNDTFHSTKHKRSFHIYSDCRRLTDEQNLAIREINVSAYPVGFKPICKRCVQRWRSTE